jgi:AmmeMemoRadiSam system protein B
MNALVRPPAVAGMFYPGDPSTLRNDVNAMLTTVPATSSSRPPKAIVVPHAGYIYSGPVAASVYARLRALTSPVRRVVLLGPTHRVGVEGLALPQATHFSTPLGAVEIDREAVSLLEGMPQVVVANAPHAQEHSLEVQLPFLQSVLHDFRLLPLAVGRVSAESVSQVLDRLWGGDETLFVISTDLSHYLPYASACEIDRATAARILALDSTISLDEACGATGLNGMLLAARRHGLQAHLVDLRNSGDTAGDRSRVVGYGGFVLHTGTNGVRGEH